MIKTIFFFALFGVIGISLEVFVNAVLGLRKSNRTLMGYSSLWMFFIYGSAYFIVLFVTHFLFYFNILIRGFIYMSLFYGIEFGSGFVLKKFKAIPWDYSKFKYNLKGLVSLEFAPFWFIGGIILESVYLYLKFIFV